MECFDQTSFHSLIANVIFFSDGSYWRWKRILISSSKSHTTPQCVAKWGTAKLLKFFSATNVETADDTPTTEGCFVSESGVERATERSFSSFSLDTSNLAVNRSVRISRSAIESTVSRLTLSAIVVSIDDCLDRKFADKIGVNDYCPISPFKFRIPYRLV